MPRIVAALFLTCLTAGAAWSQHDPIEGAWMSSSGKAKIQIFRVGSGFNGKIVWLQAPLRDGKPKVDARNPDEHLHNRPILGLQILQGLKPSGDGVYEGGTVYDPQSGKSYDCKATLHGANELSLRGFVGFSLLGKTMVWTRVD